MGLYDGHNDDSIYEDCYSDRSLLDTPSAPAPTPNLCPASRSVQLKPALLLAPDPGQYFNIPLHPPGFFLKYFDWFSAEYNAS